MLSAIKSSKVFIPTALGAMLLLSSQAVACPPAKDGTVKPCHITSINIHQPGNTKDDLANVINIFLPMGSGYRVDAKGTGSGKLGPAMQESLEKGKLTSNLVFTYGRTGEIPPGRDIFRYLHLAKDKNMLAALPDRYTVKPEFAALVNDVNKGGYLSVPYVGAVAIVYNPDLIDKKDVPKSWKELANFNGSLAVTGSGCYAMRTLTALYKTVGEKKFEKIVKKAEMPALETMKKDPRPKDQKPLGGTNVPVAVMEGKFQVGVGPLTSTRVQEGIASGALGVIWPAEGAFAMPHILAVRANPNEADLALADFIAKGSEVRRILYNVGISSTLRGGRVIPVVKENNFKFRFIPVAELMDQKAHKRIIEIVEKNKPKA